MINYVPSRSDKPMKPLTFEETQRAIELLDLIVRPVEDSMNEVGRAITEAQNLLGYDMPKPGRRRSFYGVRRPK